MQPKLHFLRNIPFKRKTIVFSSFCILAGLLIFFPQSSVQAIGSPTLKSPMGSTSDSTPTFSWNGVGAHHYGVWVRHDNNFTAPGGFWAAKAYSTSKTWGDGSWFTFGDYDPVPANLSPGTTYYWLVVACADSGCNETSFSSTASFQITGTPTCNCTSWVDLGCGGGVCAPDKRGYTRTCTPSGCDYVNTCLPDVACAPGDTTPPAVNIAEPLAGATVSGTIKVKAHAADPESAIEWVKIVIDYTRLCTDYYSPYECYWDTTTVSDGSHKITAWAKSGGGENTRKINVTVNNAAPTCNCTSWVDLGCGGGVCASDKRGYTRTCTPSGCDYMNTCLPDVACISPGLSKPTISPFCSGTISKATISWTGGDGSSGFWADIDNDANWRNGFWNKQVSSRSTTAPDGFNPAFGASGSLVLNGDSTYYVRVFDPKIDRHSPTAFFVAKDCAAPTPTPAANLEQSSTCSNNVVSVAFSWTPSPNPHEKQFLDARKQGDPWPTVGDNVYGRNTIALSQYHTSAYATKPFLSETWYHWRINTKILGKWYPSEAKTFKTVICEVPGPVCGNGVCESGENYLNCRIDCPLIPPTLGRPTLQEPPYGATNVSNNPIFKWSKVSGASRYGVWLGKSPYLSTSPFWAKNVYPASCSGGSCSTGWAHGSGWLRVQGAPSPPSTLTVGKTYYWLVWACTDGECPFSGISRGGRFTVAGVPPDVNQPPNIPFKPSGLTSGQTNTDYTYSTSTTDPDGDQIKYGWDWDGNGTIDEWSNFKPSGISDSRPHSWDTAGTYYVQVKAKDSKGGESAWSDSLVVTITTTGGPGEKRLDVPHFQQLDYKNDDFHVLAEGARKSAYIPTCQLKCTIAFAGCSPVSTAMVVQYYINQGYSINITKFGGRDIVINTASGFTDKGCHPIKGNCPDPNRPYSAFGGWFPCAMLHDEIGLPYRGVNAPILSEQLRKIAWHIDMGQPVFLDIMVAGLGDHAVVAIGYKKDAQDNVTALYINDPNHVKETEMTNFSNIQYAVAVLPP